MRNYKFGLAQREMNETLYWLDLLRETDCLTREAFDSIHADALELIRLITDILITTKKRPH